MERFGVFAYAPPPPRPVDEEDLPPLVIDEISKPIVVGPVGAGLLPIPGLIKHRERLKEVAAMVWLESLR